MIVRKKDFGIDVLFAQNRDRYFIDEKGDLEVIIKAVRVDITPERPHGLKYSLVVLNAKGERVIGFDNAHGVSHGSGPGKKNSKQYDHKHIGDKVQPYNFVDANTLVVDFWKEVDKLV